jgi:4-amino-4-deoxy-L-arabinose transferase-like glycosyltransferase
MPLQPAWAKPRNVALLIAGYLLVHMGVRLWMGSTLGLDDAEQALFAQHWLLNYRFRAPPLFTWILVAAGDLIGTGMLAISLIRYALLAILFGFIYLTARRLIRDERLAALATYSFTAVYVFGYYSHHDLTHTTALSAFLAAGWYVFVRLCETPTTGWYLALGLCFGLGMLGKWNFIMFALALPLACLLYPAYRGLVLNWRIVLAALVTAAVVLPSVLWALHVGPASGDHVGGLLGRDDGSFLRVLVAGTLELARAVLVYPQPFLVIFLLAFGREAWSGLWAQGAAAPTREPVPDSRLVGLTIAIAIALHWLLVPLARATDFDERLLQPALLILPVYLFMLVERSGMPPRAIRAYGAAIAGVVAVVLVARVGIHAAGADYCRGNCRALVPFPELAAGLRSAGFKGGGTIVVSDFHIGGNLRVQFPDARIMQIGYPSRVWPKPSGTGQCLAVWTGSAGAGERARRQVDAYLAKEFGISTIAPRREGTAAAAMHGSMTRSYQLSYALYEAPQGECR